MNESPEASARSVERRSIPTTRLAGISAASAEMVARLRAGRYRLGISLAIFLGVNFILLGLYLWSHGGETVHVQIIAQGDEFTAFIDGETRALARLDAPEQGTIQLVLGSTEDVPSLPKPRGITSIRVSSLSNGQTLFEDDFKNGPSPEWSTNPGMLVIGNGVVGARGETPLTLGARPWTDVVIDMTFRNPGAVVLRMRATTDNSGVEYYFRPFRHYDNGFTLIQAGTPGQYFGGTPVEVSNTETVKSLLAMVLGPYPYIFALLGIALLFVAALQFLGASIHIPDRVRDSLVDAPWFAAAGMAAFGLIVTAFINYSYGDHMPHVPDELAYLFQAKLFAGFHVSAPEPRVPAVFDYFYPPFILVQNGLWIGVYPFGHPLLLAFGQKINAVWLVPPIVGAATVLLVFAVGRKVYGGRVGLLAALVLVTSPFFLMTSSNFMSHNSAAFYLMGSLFCIAIADRRPILYGVLGGLLYGLFFNTQQLTAVALVAPVGALLLSNGIPAAHRMRTVRLTGGFVLGGVVMLGAFLLYNLSTTGDAFTSGLQLGADPAKLLLFGGENTPSLGIQNQQIQLAYLILVLNGWPLYVGLMLILMPFVLATRHRWDWFLLVAAVAAMGVYVLYIGHGVMHGPRYWYAAAPLLALLTARGADRAAEVLSDLAGRLRSRITGGQGATLWPGVLVVYPVVLALVGAGIYGWLLGRHTSWGDEFVPNKAVALRSFNNVDDRLVQLVDDSDIHDALVLVGDCLPWQCYGSLFWLNNTTLDGDIVYAKDIPERRAELFAAYPNRYVYIANYLPPASLSPFGSTGPVIIEDGTPNAPRAEDIDLPTPTATQAPEVPNPQERDEQRMKDLATIADALQQYFAIHGAYPVANGVQSFCRYPELDSGCKVMEVLPALPRDPDERRTYYYLSSGTSFVLWVETDNPAEPSDCPEAEPKPGIDPAHAYCVQGRPESAP
jgi:4-amino-4-deoxy-L-arabinose transferase-like glycosyltransferase